MPARIACSSLAARLVQRIDAHLEVLPAIARHGKNGCSHGCCVRTCLSVTTYTFIDFSDKRGVAHQDGGDIQSDVADVSNRQRPIAERSEDFAKKKARLLRIRTVGSTLVTNRVAHDDASASAQACSRRSPQVKASTVRPILPALSRTTGALSPGMASNV